MAMTTATKWIIDPAHSDIQFKVKHLGMFNVTGTFKQFEGDVVSEHEDFSDAVINFTIHTNSIDTNQPDRDTHLKSADFFNTEKYPHITFKGTYNNDTLSGNLTINDITQPVTLNAELTGVGKGRFGETRAGFEVDGKINRKDFGLVWNLLMETGGVVVSEEIKLHFNIQLTT
ncbi:YceI family protein [Chitinophaga sp. YR573]|uniref:YceI family protein n=1 Tax=Chitinophaga sp. YR573 TaxID=1881040 RepID=UPI002100BA02|nr:YceI family protein [Chitinophaga sp. YR573]